jgi:hypothetical protein
MIIVEQSVQRELTGETEILGQNLPQCLFDHHKSYTTWPELEPRPLFWKAGDNSLSYGTPQNLTPAESNPRPSSP